MRPTTNPPIYSLLALALFVGSALAMVLAGKAESELFLAMIVTTVPSLVAALAAERAARDIRNGTMVEKVRQGASEAIAEHQLPEKLDAVASEQGRVSDELRSDG